MNFLGIGPGELFFVIIIALVVLGPERLPGFARSLGASIIRLRNWLNASPDAKVLLQIQHELQTEINEIRSTLREVSNSVRSDLNDTTKTLSMTTTALNAAITEAAQTSNATLNDAVNTPYTPAADQDRTIAKPIEPTAVAPDAAAAPTTVEDDQRIPPTVARSSKPNWMNPPATASSQPDTTPPSETAVDQVVTPVQPPQSPPQPVTQPMPDSAIYAEIRGLKAEISRLKEAQTNPPATDTVTQFHAEIEQLTREMKELRKSVAAVPAQTVTSDTIMFLRIEIGQLTNRIDELQRHVQNTNGESNP